jgi:hypothetical protein
MQFCALLMSLPSPSSLQQQQRSIKKSRPEGGAAARDEHATYVRSSFSHAHNFKRFLIEIKAALCVKIVAVKKVLSLAENSL